MFTPTEAAAIGAAATCVLAIASGRMNRAAFASSLLETAKATGMIFLILISAEIYNGFLALSQVTAGLVDLLAGSGLSPMSILIGLLLVYLVLGCFMDSLAMILLTVPVFFPLLAGLDFGYSEDEDCHLVWHSDPDCRGDRIDYATDWPQCLHDQRLDGETQLIESFKGTVPFLLSGVVLLAMVLYLPAMCLWLPGRA